MLSQVMKLGSNILSPSDRLGLAIKIKIWATKHSKRPVIERKEGFGCNFLLWLRSRNKSSNGKGQKHHGKALQRRTQETEKVLSGAAPCHWF